jgi:ATP-binding cassette subfamily C (CFTR/MRP) protein 1
LARYTDMNPPDKIDQDFSLAQYSLRIPKASLTAVVGPVASGKSSLFASLLGDMKNLSGKVTISGDIAYSQQQAWIRSSSVRDNILFGQNYDPVRYSHVVAACALDADLKELPDGDSTILGERGITVSGGQKARIGLARSLYLSSPILLLDDPLSAVDAHTGAHIFRHAIVPAAKSRAVLLVTHQTNVLSQCDRVIWMDRGCIRHIDTYRNLIDKYPDFVDFVQHDRPNNHDQLTQVLKTELRDDIDGSELMINEERQEHLVPWSTYFWYLTLGLRLPLFGLLCFHVLLSQYMNNLYTFQVAWWSSDRFHLSTTINAIILAAIVLGHMLFWQTAYRWIRAMCLRASNNLSDAALKGLMGAPISFFDTTPSGRIMNRFTVVRGPPLFCSTLTAAGYKYA